MESSNSSDSVQINDVFEVLSEAVKNINIFRSSSVEVLQRDQKLIESSINERIAETEKLFVENKEICLGQDRARYWYLLGKMYNCSPNQRTGAIDCYGKAVKLDPSMVSAWNELGEAYWHKGDRDMAKSCFEGALAREKNKVSLRNLSLIARNEAQESADRRKENVEKGISFAKEAINLDIADGHSWSVLGNAYLTYFFVWKQENSYIDQAIQAYTQAEKTDEARSNPEVHYNKGVALKFKELYKQAIECFSAALKIDMGFSYAALKLNLLIKYLDKIQVYNDTKGKLKPRKLKNLIEDLKKNGSGVVSKNQKVTRKLLHELAYSRNEDVYVDGKVLWSTHIDDSFPFTFGFMDLDENVAVVTVYNLSLGKGVIIGDTVAILSPIVERINFKYDTKEYNFLKIRMNCPLAMVVNKKSVPASYRSLGCLTTLETR